MLIGYRCEHIEVRSTCHVSSIQRDDGRRGLRHFVMRLRLDGVHEIGKFDAVLDEENRHVISNEVPVALIRIEFCGKAAGVADGVGRASEADDGREADEDGCLYGWLLERDARVRSISGS